MAKKKCGFTKILLVGVVAAAIAALVAAWRASSPVQDPWKLPAPEPTTHDPVATAEPATVEEIQNLTEEK